MSGRTRTFSVESEAQHTTTYATDTFSFVYNSRISYLMIPTFLVFLVFFHLASRPHLLIAGPDLVLPPKG